MVGNISLTSNNPTNEYQNNVATKRGEIAELNTVSTGKYLLKRSSFEELRTHTQYTEIRLKCHKPSHGRTVDLAITLDTLVYNFIRGQGSVFNYCGRTFKKLDDDTSNMLRNPCSSLYSSTTYGTGIETAIIYVSSRYHILLSGSRIECDDYVTSPGLWAYYVRWWTLFAVELH